MELAITTRLTKDELYDFAIYNTYSKFNGFLLILLGIALNFIGLIGKFHYGIENWKFFAYMLLGITVILYTPLNIKIKIQKLSDTDKIFSTKKYEFNKNGIVSDEVNVDWNSVNRYVRTQKNIGLYFGYDKAIIIPKKDIINSYESLNKIIISNISIENMLFS